MNDIVTWDKSEATLTEALVKKFDYALQLVRSYHMNPRHLKHEEEQFQKEREQFYKEGEALRQQLAQAESVDAKAQLAAELARFETAKSNLEAAQDFMTPSTDWQKVWDSKKYQFEREIRGEEVTLPMLEISHCRK
ncbi:hypothetical protein [Legionella sp. WA2022007384]